MKNVVVVGTQWGDEGKGKIVDWLSDQADVIIRFQGGHNAGHTLVIDGVTYKLRLLPSGIVRKNKISVIGNGVVVDPWALLEEIEEIQAELTTETPDKGAIQEEIGDLLFACVNLARHLETDPEVALRQGNNKFEARFRAVEAELTRRGKTPAQSTLAEMDQIWDDVKRAK